MDARALLLILVLVAGCVSPGIVPPKEAVKKVRAIHIVAMETPPLGVPPEFRHAVPLYASPLLIYNTIAVLIEWPAAQRRGAEVSRSLQASLETKGNWIPTLALADMVRAQLEARGIAAGVAPAVRPIPAVQNRDYTLLMENWMAPIRAWYNDTKPDSGYAGLPSGQPLYVLEVGVANYEIVEDKLLMTVMMMKMIDPSDGRVTGRARARMNPANMPVVGPPEQAFGNDAKRFKEVVTAEGYPLIKECLAQLRLVE